VILSGETEDVEAFTEGANAPGMRIYRDSTGVLSVATCVVPESTLQDFLASARRIRLQRIDVPDWITGAPQQALKSVDAELARAGNDIRQVRGRIDEQSETHRVGAALWCIERQNWLEGVLEKANRGTQFLRIGGWVPRHRYAELVERLRGTGRPFLVRFEDGRSHGVSPSLLSNPSWVRRFELFVNGFGTPAADEVDPSVVLALITPLMFGYMFGDVGQGLLLMILGFALRDRLPWIALLIPAGASAVVFGFLYGSLFSIEGILPALWVHPMEHPLLILGVPLVFGAMLMFLSMTFGFMRSGWRGEGRHWMWHHVPLILCYAAAPTAAVAPPVAVLMVVFAVAMLAVRPTPATTFTFANRLVRFPGALLELLEQWLQLIINTLSFTRLGAFALAHAGLGMALLALAELPRSSVGTVLVLVLGNLLITALEGLVVSIQTTRLVMFEFFRRFFDGTGRSFHPLTLAGHPDAGTAGSAPPRQAFVKP
jgi:V/A-type H+-transporting ATPase subunit I